MSKLLKSSLVGLMLGIIITVQAVGFAVGTPGAVVGSMYRSLLHGVTPEVDKLDKLRTGILLNRDFSTGLAHAKLFSILILLDLNYVENMSQHQFAITVMKSHENFIET